MSRRPRRWLLTRGVAAGVATAAGCLGRFVGSSSPDIPSEAFPPGTDESGVVDVDTLFAAHLEGLQDRSYTYEQRFDPGSDSPTQKITGRQQGGVTGPRFVRTRRSFVVESDSPAYRMSHSATVDAWHGPDMPVDSEYRKIVSTTKVTYPETYNESSPHADEYPPGERTTYERFGFNSLELSQKDYLRGVMLYPIAYRPTRRVERDGQSFVRFAVDGLSEEGRGGGSVAATGHLLIRSDGLISEGELVLEATDGDETAEANARISALRATRVRSEPSWVSREFSKA